MIKDLKEIYVLNQRYLLFFIAALSLMLAGGISSREADFKTLFSLSIITFLGVFWIYRVNILLNYKKSLKLNLHRLLINKYYTFSGLSILLLVILGPFLINPFRFKLLALSAILGLLYSFEFKAFNFQLKKIFFLKNLSIGIAWGLLIPIGSGSFNSKTTITLTILAITQVFIGSMIRDIPDIKKDLSQHVKSFPVAIGIKNSILFMHALNLFPLFYVIFISSSFNLSLLILTVSLWRLINLFMIVRNPQSIFWLQKFNLMTCVIIFLMVLIVEVVLSSP